MSKRLNISNFFHRHVATTFNIYQTAYMAIFRRAPPNGDIECSVEFYLYPTVGTVYLYITATLKFIDYNVAMTFILIIIIIITVLIHSVKPELTE